MQLSTAIDSKLLGHVMKRYFMKLIKMLQVETVHVLFRFRGNPEIQSPGKTDAVRTV